MNALLGVLRERIARNGPLRFDEFQEAALYTPGLGYYERPGRVGPLGDFVTGASWHPAFARCLARLHARLEEELGESATFVDVGAGEGELLGSVAAERPGRHLVGVERSATRRGIGERRSPAADWVSGVEALPRVIGLVHAYELFDALPVRALCVSAGGRLLERRVGVDARGRLRFVETACEDADRVLEGLAARGASLEAGQRLEVRPGAADLMRGLASRLERGLLVVFDYGAPTRALYGPAHHRGTLESFRAQRVSREVLSGPGSRDITAWVDFGELAGAARQAGLEVGPLVSQSRFLLQTGVLEEMGPQAPDGEPPGAVESVRRNSVAKLFAPGGMGESLRVLVAGRGTRLVESLTR